MSKFLMAVFCVLGVVLCCAGEVDEPRRKDVTDDKSWWGGYEPGKEYVTGEDLFLVEVKGARQALFPPKTNTGLGDANSYTSHVTPSFEEYKKDPTKWPFVQGILAKDTHLRVTMIELFSTITHSKVHICAEIVGGEIAKQPITLNSLSKGASAENLLLLEPDPKYLKKAKE